MTTFESIDEAVFVTTFCTPPTSFWSRDWRSPVRVPVKKRSDIDCRCSYSRFRRSCITLLADDRRRGTSGATPSPAATSGTTIISATRMYRSCRSGPLPPGGKSAWSKTDLRQQRVDDAEGGRDEDQHEHDRDLEPVRPEQARDAAEEASAALERIGRHASNSTLP